MLQFGVQSEFCHTETDNCYAVRSNLSRSGSTLCSKFAWRETPLSCLLTLYTYRTWNIRNQPVAIIYGLLGPKAVLRPSLQNNDLRAKPVSLLRDAQAWQIVGIRVTTSPEGSEYGILYWALLIKKVLRFFDGIIIYITLYNIGCQSQCLIHTLAERTLLSSFSCGSSVYEVNFNTSFSTTSHPLFLVWKHVFICTSSEICLITMATVRCLPVLLPQPFHLAQLCDSGRRTWDWWAGECLQ